MSRTAKLADLAGAYDSGGGFGFKNRIINGAMVIDQRNAGAEVNPAVSNTYYTDRWNAVSGAAGKFKIGQNAGSVTPPSGFSYYTGLTSLSAYTVGASESFGIQQRIEGYNMADLAWGTASAVAVTLSFWVRSSLTGTFGGALRNSAADRSYPFSYTISAANTWEQKTVTIAGDTTGTWLTTTGIGMSVLFAIGTGSTSSGTAGAWAAADYRSATGATSVVGTNGATFYITGVQLEKGSTATSFDYRPYGTELQLAQRYYFRLYPSTSNQFGSAFSPLGNFVMGVVPFPSPMRIAPSALEQTGTAGDYSVFWSNGNIACNAVQSFYRATTSSGWTVSSVASGVTQNTAGLLVATNTSAYLGWSAEL